LLPKVLDFNLLQSSLHKLVNFGKDILLPILKKLVLLDLRRLGLQQIFALDVRVSFQSFLLDLIGGIKFLKFEGYEVFLDISMKFVISDVVAKEMKLLVLVVYQFKDEFLDILLVL
jgi:hypothetical protein